MGKHLLVMRETGFDLWIGKIPWRRKWRPTPVLSPGESHGRRSLVGSNPWGCKESDTTEQLHFLSFFLLSMYLARSCHVWQPRPKARKLSSPGSVSVPRKDFDWPCLGHVSTLGPISAVKEMGYSH